MVKLFKMESQKQPTKVLCKLFCNCQETKTRHDVRGASLFWRTPPEDISLFYNGFFENCIFDIPNAYDTKNSPESLDKDKCRNSCLYQPCFQGFYKCLFEMQMCLRK